MNIEAEELAIAWSVVNVTLEDIAAMHLAMKNQIEELRQAVKAAYKEGFFELDGEDCVPSEEFERAWRDSVAHAVIDEAKP